MVTVTFPFSKVGTSHGSVGSRVVDMERGLVGVEEVVGEGVEVSVVVAVVVDAAQPKHNKNTSARVESITEAIFKRFPQTGTA